MKKAHLNSRIFIRTFNEYTEYTVAATTTMKSKNRFDFEHVKYGKLMN